MSTLELRKLDEVGLRELLLSERKELFKLRAFRAMKEEGLKPHLFRVLRKKIAVLKTLINEKGGKS